MVLTQVLHRGEKKLYIEKPLNSISTSHFGMCPKTNPCGPGPWPISYYCGVMSRLRPKKWYQSQKVRNWILEVDLGGNRLPMFDVGGPSVCICKWRFVEVPCVESLLDGVWWCSSGSWWFLIVGWCQLLLYIEQPGMCPTTNPCRWCKILGGYTCVF